MFSVVRDIILGRSISSGSRIYGPSDLKDTFLIEELDEDGIKPVLAKIQKLYGMAEASAHRNGFCFGLLDPVSNIVVNSVISGQVAAKGGRGDRVHQSAADMAMRSLGGLIAFLTYLFPYLPDAEAVRYLDAAGADAIVACLLIVRRRGMTEFNPCSETAVAAFETALRCAAIAAQYPDPEEQLVLAWKWLSSRDLHRETAMAVVLDMVNNNGAGPGTSSNDDSGAMSMEKSWDLARRRLGDIRVRELPPVRAAMKRMLLATIHGFYLQALAMLPTKELCTQYHRSMLMGGYCYGPLDPVSNIIVNTLWYEHNFPMTGEQVTLHMISTESLRRVAARSLYGLVSFLCTRYHGLTPDLALERLLVARADLRAADPNLQLPEGRGDNNVPLDLDCSCCYQVESVTTDARELQRTPSANAEEAYAAAATAAFHPDPSAQKELLGSPSAMPILQVASEVLQHGRLLSAEDISSLSQLLLSSLSSTSEMKDQQQQEQPERINKRAYTFMSNCAGRFWGQHGRVCDKVQAALDAFNKDRELKYNVHVICGVNELVSGPQFSIDAAVRGYNPRTPFKYHHSHINFMATYAGSKPTLFFAECSNHGTDNAWCIPVEPLRPLAEHIRCIYCEHEGNMIVHPVVKGFHGRNREFEKVLRGEPLFDGSNEACYSNNQIVTYKQQEVDWVHSVRDDYVYTVNYANTSSTGDDDVLENFRRNIDFA